MIALIPSPEVDVDDAILEGLTLVAFAFILVMAFHARRRNKIFASRGFWIMVLAITLGLVAALMDFLTEFFWIESLYEEYKLVMNLLFVSSLFLFAVALLVVFKFTQFLLGEDE
ncbi:MAG: hypothetical protein ACTSU5_10480 [Promethearchaeota archaeon]